MSSANAGRPLSPRTRKVQMLESKFMLLKQMAALDKLTGIMRRVESAKRSRRFNHWKTRVNELKVSALPSDWLLCTVASRRPC